MIRWALAAAGLMILLVATLLVLQQDFRPLPAFKVASALSLPEPTFPEDAPAITRIPVAGDSTCSLPPIPRGSRFLFAGFYEGQALSTVTVAGQDEETFVAELEIESGTQPITLVLSAYGAMVYRFSGDTERIARAIVLHRGGAGVSGLPATKVSFASAAACQLPYDLNEQPDEQVEQVLRARFGRGADWRGGIYDLYHASVGPDGMRFAEASAGSNATEPMVAELYRFHPAGVTGIERDSVVASGIAEDYLVLPQEAGLVQLLRARAIRPSSGAELAAAGGRPPGGGDVFRVLRPIRIPPGLCGAHSVAFVAPDPSFVTGDRCHSTIAFLNGGGTNLDPAANTLGWGPSW